MKKTTLLIAYIAIFMMGFLSPSTAKAETKKFVGMLPMNPASFRNLTTAEFIAYLTKQEVPADIMKIAYAPYFKDHVAEYSALANQQVKARIQAINHSTEKMTDVELVDYINNKTEMRVLPADWVVISTATVIDSATGKVIGHGMAKTRKPRLNEKGCFDIATNQVISYMSCVNTDATSVKEKEKAAEIEQMVFDEIKSDEPAPVYEKVGKANGDIYITFSPKMIQYQGGATATVTAPAATVVEKTKKSAWDDDNTDYSNHYSTEKTKKVDYDDERYEWVKKVKSCNDCDDGQNKVLLAEILRQQRKAKRIAIADLVFDIANLGVSATHFGMWLSGLLKGRKGNDSIDSVFGSGSDGGFVYTSNTNQQQGGGAGGDGTFVNGN